jgi:predicted PurR-regulated permease PerM
VPVSEQAVVERARAEARSGRLPRPSLGVALILLLVFLWAVREVLPPFVIAAAIAYLTFPLVAAIERRLRAPRVVIVLVFYLLLLGVLGGLGWVLVPRLVAQVGELRAAAPRIADEVLRQLTGTDQIELGGELFTGESIVRRLTVEVNSRVASPGELRVAAELAVHYIVRLLVFFVALLYLLLDGPRIIQYVLGFFGPRRPAAEGLLARVDAAWGRYVRGQLLLVVLMSIVSWLVLAFVFQLPYAFVLGIATGVLEVIPLLGPLLAGGIACAVAISHGGAGLAAWVALAYVVLRQIEDQLVMPLVVGRAVHLSPIVTLFSVLCGERIAGPLGMILAIPIAAAAKILLDVWRGTVDVESPSRAGH